MIGIIGGSGLENLNIFDDFQVIDLETPYGKPSSEIIKGKLYGKEVAILSRHGRNHTITPTHVNNRANISALKNIGCEKIIATTACGSLNENIAPGDFAIPDQFIDFTRHRHITFFDSFEPGELKHCQMAEPFSDELRKKITETASKLNQKLHTKATIITIEGPRFSTRAESFMFRNWGADLINMSTAPEVILANEIEIPYAAIALCTDYDCWKTDLEPVSWEQVLSVFNKNVNNITKLLVELIKNI
jgi:5'-methylthioadenosine phosphorylase